jgi:predicted Zn-dependent protease
MNKKNNPKQLSSIAFNWKLLLATIAVIAVVSGSAYAIRNVQARSISKEYLRLAEEAKASDTESSKKKAIGYLEKYLMLNRDDTGAHADLAELVDDTAKSRSDINRAITVYAAAIGHCESKDEFKARARQLRHRQAERLFEVGRYEDALEQAAASADSEWDAELVRLIALSRYRLNLADRPDRWSPRAEAIAPEWLRSQAQKHFAVMLDEAFRTNPGNVELTNAFANVLLNEPQRLKDSPFEKANSDERKNRAKSLASSMLLAHTDDPDAWISHYNILKIIDPKEASDSIEEAQQRFPDNKFVLRTAGQHYLDAARTSGLDSSSQKYKDLLAKAEKELRASLDDPTRAPTVTALPLGDLLMQQNKSDEAIAAWTSGLGGQPPTAQLHFRIVSAWTERQDWEMAEQALKAMDKSINQETPSLPRITSQTIAFVARQKWAEFYYGQGNYEAVIRLLDPVAGETASALDGPTRAKSLAILGSAYSRAEQWDKAGTVFEQAAELDSEYPAYKRNTAEAWVSAGRFDQALQQLQAIDPKTANDWFVLALTIFNIQAGTEATPALWATFDQAIAEAKKGNVPGRMILSGQPEVKDWQVRQLELLSLIARAAPEGRAEKAAVAAQELIDLCEANPTDVEQWRRTMIVLDTWKQQEALENARKKFIERNPNSREGILTQAQGLFRERKLKEARDLVVESILKHPERELEPLDALRLCDSTESLEATTGELIKWADQSLLKNKELAELTLDNLNSWLSTRGSDAQAASGSKTRGNETETAGLSALDAWNRSLQKIEEKIKTLEGASGTEWKAVQAKRLIELAARDETQNLNSVAEIVRSLEAQRPLWAETHVVSGFYAEKKGDLANAIKSYSRAINLGKQELIVYERLISCMYRQGMFAEAQQILNRLGDRAGRSKKLEEFAISVPGRSKSDMLSIARAGVESRSLDPMSWVVYGSVIEATSRGASKKDRAEQLKVAYDAFEKAENLDTDGSVKVLNAEHGFYSALRDKEKLSALYERVKNAARLEEAGRWELMGKLEQSLGDMDAAEASFIKAMDAGGSRTTIGNLLGKNYLVTGKSDKAIELFDKLYRDYPKDFDVRQSLSSLLAARGSAEDWERINAMLLDPRYANEVSDRRYLAILRYRRGNPGDLEKARTLLEDIAVDSTARTDEDSYMLAVIAATQARSRSGKYSNERERIKSEQLADRHFQLATASANANPAYLADYIAFLLELNRLDDAANKMQQFKSIQPNSLATALLDAKIKRARNKNQEANESISKWRDSRIAELGDEATDTDRIPIDADTAFAFLQVDDFEAADPLFNQFIEKNPTIFFELAVRGARLETLAARSYALKKLVDVVRDRPSEDNAYQIMRLLKSRNYEPEVTLMADTLLLEIQAGEQGNQKYQMSIGDMWLDRKFIGRAIDSYRKVVELDPSNVIALNNIACLVAEETGVTDESLKLIDKAIEIGGRTADLLDSKGHILVIAGRHAEAVPFFEEASNKGSDPRIMLHLHGALKNSGKAEEAARLRRKIDLDGVRKMHLSPEESKEVEIMASERL